LIGFAGERRGKRVSFYSLGNHHYQPPDEIYDIREGGRESERKYISDPERRRREKKRGALHKS
jgi:hypothetical protein